MNNEMNPQRKEIRFIDSYYKDLFHLLDGGQLDNPELSMTEARSQILSDFGLAFRDLRATPYETVMEKAEQHFSEQRSSVMEQLSKAAEKIPSAKSTHKHTEPEL